jgi:metacaspase-1
VRSSSERQVKKERGRIRLALYDPVIIPKGGNTMAKGIALTLGLNAVDLNHYGGWSGELNACEADANDMAEIAKSRKFKVKTLLTNAATRAKFTGEISRAAKALISGDIFMLSYSGHGGQLPDLNNDEPDAQDETWCLYDGEFVDDELYAQLSKFAPGVRILVFSDSCHSGTVVKLAYYQGTTGVRGSSVGSTETRYRFMPPDVALRTYRNNKGFYDKILKSSGLKKSAEAVKASVLLISGCQDNQLSADGDFNGLFTSQLLRVWKNGAFKGDYRKFHADIRRRMPPDQTPNYFRAGQIDKKFEAQVPFTV